jgi:hypothetical protein
LNPTSGFAFLHCRIAVNFDVVMDKWAVSLKSRVNHFAFCHAFTSVRMFRSWLLSVPNSVPHRLDTDDVDVVPFDELLPVVNM